MNTGEVSGSTSAKRLPSVTGAWVRIKAVLSNAGNVYVGGSSVTRPDGSTDATTGYELDAGDEITFPLVTRDLNEIWIICDNAGDDVTYQVF